MEPETDFEGLDVNAYFALAECGVIAPDERVELLEGLIVSMAPMSPLHAAVVYRVEHLLIRKLGSEIMARVRMPFLAGRKSVPEPDIAVVPRRDDYYFRRHPAEALLIVEVSDSSLAQDRITKSAIYARAGVPTYWIVNLRDDSIECFNEPDQVGRRYMQTLKAAGSMRLPLAAFPDVVIEAAELIPEETT